MMSFIKQSFQSKSLWAIADQAIFSGSNFLITLFLARQLAIPDFGLFSSIVLVVYLIMSVSNAFIIQPFQVSYAATENKSAYLFFLLTSFLITLLIILLSLSVINLFVPTDYILGGSFIPAFLFVTAYLFQDFFRKIFLALSNVALVVITDLLFLFIVVGGCYLLRTGMTLNETFTVIALANFFSAIPALIILIKKMSWSLQFHHFLKDHIKQGKWLLSVAILQWSSSNFFVLVSGIYLGMEALGALRLVQSFFGLLNIALQSVENFFLPKIATMYHKKPENAINYLLKISSWGAILFGAVLLLLFIFANSIIVWAGGAPFAAYAYVVRIMVVLYGIIFLSYPLRIGLRVLLLNRVFFIGYFISFLSSLLSFHFLLQHAGLYGAVLGLIINQLIMIIYWLREIKKNQFLLCR